MSADVNRALAIRFHACDINDYCNLMSSDFIGHDAMGHSWNRDFQVAGLVADLEAFSGLRDRIDDLLVDGERVAVRFTRSGLFVRKFESFAPTNREVNFDVLEILHIRDGLIAEAWCYNDDSTVARTLSGET